MSLPAIPSVELTFAATPSSARRAEPVTCGIPWPRGVLTDPAVLRMRDSNGQGPVLQTKVLDRWPDGTVRWLLLDWQATVNGPTTWTLYSPGPPGEPVGPRIKTEARPKGGLVIDTGVAQFVVGVGRFPFEQVKVNGAEAIDPTRTGFRFEDGSGKVFRPNTVAIADEAAGPVRRAVRLSGTLDGPGGSLADFTLRMHFFAGSATVRFDLTVTNPRKADHPGGLWGLGSVTVKAASRR
jgi:hypothetical protein